MSTILLRIRMGNNYYNEKRVRYNRRRIGNRERRKNSCQKRNRLGRLIRFNKENKKGIEDIIRQRVLEMVSLEVRGISNKNTKN